MLEAQVEKTLEEIKENSREPQNKLGRGNKSALLEGNKLPKVQTNIRFIQIIANAR